MINDIYLEYEYFALPLWSMFSKSESTKGIAVRGNIMFRLDVAYISVNYVPTSWAIILFI